MHRIWSLTKKELRTYFNSPIAYITITVLLIGIGYFFFQTFFISGQTTMRTFFRLAGWSFLLLAPAVTMKLLAEEKKSGTIESLLTLPIREYEVVTAKYLAGLILLGVYLFITLAYPISISFLGNLDWGPVIGGYAGLLLLGSAYLAIGLFASAITRNQVVSLILAFIICLALFLLDLLLPLVPQVLQSVLSFIGTDTHFQSIARGVLDSRDIIFYLSLTVAFLFLATQIIEGRMSDHSASRRINKPIYILAILGAFFCLNVVSLYAFARVDLTEDKMYTLSDSTKSIMADLDDQLLVKCYFSKDIPSPFNNNARHLQELLEEYSTYSDGKLRFEFIDPGKKAEGGQADQKLIQEAEQAGVPRIEVQKLERDQMVAVKVFMGLALHYHDRTESFPVVQSVENLEYELTTRIARLVRTRTPVIAFLGGHGEATPEMGLRALGELLQQNYEIKTVDLDQENQTLEDLDVLVIAGPRIDIPSYQQFAIDQFIMNGGKAAFLIDRSEVNMQSFMGRPLSLNFTLMLETYGVRINSNLVLDEQNQKVRFANDQGGIRIQSLISYPPFVRVRDLVESMLTKNMKDLNMPFVASLELSVPEGVTANVIARSSENTWLFEIDDSFLVDPPSLPKPLPDDLVGAQPLLVTLEGSFESYFTGKDVPAGKDGGLPVASELAERSPTTRIAVVGGSVFIRDEMRNRLGLMLVNNLVDWMVQDERLIEVRSRSVTNRPLEQTSDAKKAVFKYANLLGLPFVFVLFGIIKWRVRVVRNRKGYSSPTQVQE